MYAVGHFALGYLMGKFTAWKLKMDINLPLVFLVSVLPDVDILIPWLEHRGPLHSVVFFMLVFIPFFALYGKRAAPYFVALIQHILIGDYLIAGELQLLWPLTSSTYGLHVEVASLLHVALEWTLFLVSMALLLKTGDMFRLFQRHTVNLTLFVPLVAILLPTFTAFPLDVPLSLLFPHLAFLVLFSAPILLDVKALVTQQKL